MRAIVRSAAGLLACLLPCCLSADTHTDIIDVFGAMAAALSDNNVPEFMKNFDKDFPAYDTLQIQITALVTDTSVSSSIEPIKDEGDEAKRTVEMDWYMQVRSNAPNGPSFARREIIHCELRKQGKHWKIVSLAPMEFFAPGKLDK